MQKLWAAFGRVGLPVWFAVIDAQMIGISTPGSDAVIYARGARSFLDGGNPWDASLTVSGNAFHFAGLPPTVLAFVPFARLPEGLVAVAWVAASLVCAALILRRLRLPIWYGLFPPLVLGVYSGNPQIAVLALLLVGGGPLAAILKVYAVLPMAGNGQWTAVGLTVTLFAVTLLVAPGLWITYVTHLPTISASLATEANGGFSAWSQPWPLLLATTIALLIIAIQDRPAAGWFAVPALWPASEFHYATMILPITTPLLAFVMAIPLYGVPAVATIGYAVVVVVRRYSMSRWPPHAAVAAPAV